MKKILSTTALVLIVSILSANQILQFGWEDPTKTVLGTDYASTQTLNTDEIAHSGNRSLKVWIDPFNEDNTCAYCYVWWITGLVDGDSLYASTWVYDVDSGYPKGKICFFRTSGTSFPNDMYTSSSFNGSGNSSGIGWEQLSNGCIFDSDWDMYDGIAVKLCVYAFDEFAGCTLYFDDIRLEISSNTAEIHTLPVELSSFTAVYANDFVTIQWATASEADVYGFNIYRSIEDNFTGAGKVNVDPIDGNGTTTQPHEYSFTDESADVCNTYYYWLESVNYGGTTDVYGSVQYDPVDVDGDGELNTVVHSSLSDVFPNPVRVGQNMTFSFMIGGLEGTTCPVSLNIYDIKGRLVQEIINESMMVNEYSKDWRIDDLAGGVYFYQLKTENYQATKKLVIQ